MNRLECRGLIVCNLSFLCWRQHQSRRESINLFLFVEHVRESSRCARWRRPLPVQLLARLLAHSMKHSKETKHLPCVTFTLPLKHVDGSTQPKAPASGSSAFVGWRDSKFKSVTKRKYLETRSKFLLLCLPFLVLCGAGHQT